MIAFIVNRLILALITIWVVTVISFALIQLPPGDYVEDWEYNMRAAGYIPSPEEILQMKQI